MTDEALLALVFLMLMAGAAFLLWIVRLDTLDRCRRQGHVASSRCRYCQADLDPESKKP